ncbi:MAG: DUF4153 domain-containing protein, partial [Gammaproteobacteria bacterium]|nr:DUF4153 domain-containing protein [Gammaproteobacteria bacterium]
QSDENSVWYFNYQTGVALFFAALSAIVFGGGLSLVLLSTGYLFEIKVPGIIYADIWIVAWSVLFTVYVLSNISKVYVYKDESCDFPKGISFIANYILAPLMLAYMAVLYAYFFKIVLQWELPKGNLGWMVSSFGIIGIVTKLVAYPIRDKGTRLMALFDKYFYYALVVPALMLFIAIFVRIDEYGVTEQRYAVVLLGIWFALVIAATVFIKDRFHIKYLPMSLAILVLLASYGPLSAIEVSVNSQLARFESLLIKNNLLFNGQVVKSRKKVSFEDRKVLSSIADYLGGNKWRSDKTRSMFNSLLAEEKNKDLSESKKISGTGFIALLGIDHVSKWDARRAEKVNNFSYKNSFDLNQILINVSGFDYVGRHYFYFYSNSDKKKVFTLNRNNKNEDIKVEINENFFSINSKTGGRIEFDLGAFVLDLRERGIRDTSQSNSSELTLNKSSSDGRLKVRLIIEQLNGKIRKKNDVD